MLRRNILGESFLPWVDKQINIRQEKLSPKLDQSYDRDTQIYITSKTPWVRLSSGVDVNEAKAKELGVQGLSGKLLAKASVLQGALKFDERGQKQVVSTTGGIRNLTLPASTAYGYTPGLGYPTFTNPNPYTAPTGEYTAYGYSPIPGILSVDVKPIGQQGSVREATIQMVCHNLAQFRLIDALYLRLKYSVLLEWGHSIYFDNNKQLVTNVTQHKPFLKFFTEGSTQENILDSIEETREETGGNYDCFLGYVTNFTWSYRKDGGFDITLHLRGTGDVIESIKVNVNYPSNTSVSNTTTLNLTPVEAQTLPSGSTNSGTNPSVSTDQLPPVLANKNKSTLNQILFAIKREIDAQTDPAGEMDGFEASTEADGRSSLATPSIASITKNQADYDLVASNYIDPEEDYFKESHVLVKQEGYRAKFNNITTNPGETDTFSLFYYIKLGTLLRIMESYLLKYDTTKNNSKNTYQPIFYIDYDYEENLCFTIPKQISVDPKVCLVKPASIVASNTSTPQTIYTSKIEVIPSPKGGNITLTDAQKAKYIKLTKDDGEVSLDEMNFIIQSTNPNGTRNAYQTTDGGNTYRETQGTPLTPQEIDQLNQQYNERFDKVDISINALASGPNEVEVNLYYRKTYTKNVIQETGSEDVNTSGNVDYRNIRRIKPGFRTKYPFLGRFMHILVNMDFISSTLVNHIDEDGKLSVFDFIQDIIQGIQAATGHINNYKVIYNEDANMLYIQDYNIPPDQKKYIGDLKEATKSTTTKKSYTNLNPDMKPTKINVNLVQSTAGGIGKGSFVTDVQLKTELTNNFATQITIAAQADGNIVGEDAVALSRLNIGYIDRIIKTKSSRIDASLTAENTLNAYVSNIEFRASLNARLNDGNITDNDINVGKQALVDLYKYEIGKFTKDENIPGVGFIPTNLNLTLDGISGIKLFEAYTINDEILPLNYRNAIKFMNRGVTHKIDDKGWYTMLDSLGAPDLKSTKTLTKIEVIEDTTSGGSSTTGDSGADYQSALNECGPSTTPETFPAAMLAKIQVVAKRLKAFGFTPEMTSGAIANLVKESGLNYQAWNKGETVITNGESTTTIKYGSGLNQQLDSYDVNNPGWLLYQGNTITAYGIAQWTQSRKERYTAVLKQYGYTDSLDVQAQYIVYELQLPTYIQNVVNPMKQYAATSDDCAVWKATCIWLKGYEGIFTLGTAKKRYKTALGIYNALKLTWNTL
jgi:hypothetical protein